METKNLSRIVKLFLFISLGFSLILFLKTIFGLNISQELSISSFLYLLGRFAGLVGLLFLSILIISGDTARFFDQFFGMDKIIRFQRKFALMTAIFVLFHPIFFILSDITYAAYLIPDFASMPLAFGAISLYVYISVMISSVLYKRLSYRAWQYIHISTYLLFLFSIYHATRTGSDMRNISILFIFGALTIGVMIGIIYRARYKIRQRSNRFIVEGIKWETKDTFTVALRPNKRFIFKAGQFCFLRLDKDRLFARHPFTISSSPDEKCLRFTIKLQGRFTKAASGLRKGEEVMVEGPFGTFMAEETDKDLVFIAGGVGITPFISIIKEHLNSRRKPNILLLYSSRTRDDIIFRKEFDSIKERWFKRVYILSRDEASSGMHENGHVDKAMIKKHVKDISAALFFICGPEQMKDSVKKALADLGVKKQDIMIEDFFW